MTKILAGLLAAFLFIGCSAKETNENVTPKLVAGKSIADVKFNDQFEKAHSINAETTKVIFAFSKASAHTCNDHFNTKEASYLTDNKAQFIADVSAAPSLIRSMFIMPGLKDFKHTVLIIDDETTAAEYKEGLDAEKMIVVSVDNGTIKNIQTLSTLNELIKVIEAK